MKTLAPERRELKERVGCCMKCWKQLPPDMLDVHELAAGGSREKCLLVPELQLVLCRVCHDGLQGVPPAKQIAVIVQWNIQWLCHLYCETKGLAPTAVEPADVAIFLMFREQPKKKRAKK